VTNEHFWSGEALAHILAVARARSAGPWAVLGVTLAHAIASIPHYVTLPGIVGGRMSANLFVAIVGPSGGGKGVAEAAALAGHRFGTAADVVPLGSGEGIGRTFRPIGTKPDDPNTVATAVFSAPEIDTVAALSSRAGSTLSAELRKLYSGEQLGFGNAGNTTRNVVAAGSYRACLTVGVQPLRAHALLDGADGGLPQRFVWLPSSDPDAPDDPPADPGVRRIPRSLWQVDSTLHVPDIARAQIRAHRLAVLREDPTVNPLDGHALLTRLKVAAGLMALDGRTVVSDDDWNRAGYVMAVSDQTRARCQRTITDQFRRTNTARALATADREDIISDRKVQRAKQAILRWLDKESPQTRNPLRGKLKHDLRDYFDTAAAELADAGEITISPEQNGKTEVHVYHRYTPQKHAPTSNDEGCTKSTRVPLASPAAMPTQRPAIRTNNHTLHPTAAN